MSGTTDVITITAADDCEQITSMSLRDEAERALESGREKAVEYRRDAEYNSQATEYLYLPNAGRGGVNNGGDSDWTDCTSMDDLADRWENYEDRWVN